MSVLGREAPRAAGVQPLDAVFRPRSVAVVGASADPRKRGHHVLAALREAGFSGAVYPVNPRGGEILGFRVSRSVKELPPGIDLALVCTPAETTPDVVRACGERGVRAAVVLAVGFREAGAEGAALEARLEAAAQESGVRVVGPNTSGILNLHHSLDLIGTRGLRPGGLSLLVQSGNTALSLLLDARRRSGQGLAVCVGVGNEIDIGFHEYLDFLRLDPHTGAVLVHAEGFTDAPAFLRAAARATRHKPVVFLKGARSEAGAAAALSHSGAVAGRWDLLRAGLEQAGVEVVERSDELFHVAETLLTQPVTPPGAGVAILSDGGGQGALAVDAFSAARVPLAALSEPTTTSLRAFLGRAAAVTNPVDLAGRADADPAAFAPAVELLLRDEGVGAVLVVGLFGGYGLRFARELEKGERFAAEEMARLARETGKGLVVHTMFAADVSPPLSILRERGVPVVESLEVACRCAQALVSRGRALVRPAWEPATSPTVVARGDEEVALPSHTLLTEPEARDLVEAFGVPLSPAVLCRSGAEASLVAWEVREPVAVRAVVRGLFHKSDVGGVLLDVLPEGAARAFEQVVAAVRRAGHAGAGAPAALVGPMLPPPVLELLVGVRRDPDVGLVLTVGAGGVWVELLRDVAHRVLPVSEEEILRALRTLRSWEVLRGARSRPGGDIEGVVRCVASLQRVLLEVPRVLEAEVNPLFVYPDRVYAADVKAVLEPPR